MNRFDTTDDPRRRLLVQALTAGLFTSAVSDATALGWDEHRAWDGIAAFYSEKFGT